MTNHPLGKQWPIPDLREKVAEFTAGLRTELGTCCGDVLNVNEDDLNERLEHFVHQVEALRMWDEAGK